MASIPQRHVYVRHLSPPDDATPWTVLPDSPRRPWWPPARLDPAWVEANANVFHVHFGFDAVDPSTIAQACAALRRHGKPLVHTAHDLRNPHHDDPGPHRRQLEIWLAHADEVLTLTHGAAPELRALPDVVAAVACDLVVDVHCDVVDPAGANHDPAVVAALEELERNGHVSVSVHDCFRDDAFLDHLGTLDVSPCHTAVARAAPQPARADRGDPRRAVPQAGGAQGPGGRLVTPLRIGIVAGARFPIREPYAGGMEAHTHILARALGDLGHDVVLFATGGPDDVSTVELTGGPLSLSRVNARAWGGHVAVDAVIHNGVDVRRWRPVAGPRHGLVWTGRIVPEKGTHVAVRRGAIPELIDAACGCVADDDSVDGLVRAVRVARRADPRACRPWAVVNASVRAMAERYYVYASALAV